MFSSFSLLNRVLHLGVCISCIFVLTFGSVGAQPQGQPSSLPTMNTEPSSAPILNALREGRSSLSFQLPTPSFSSDSESNQEQNPIILGFWHCATPRLNIGLNLGLNLSQNSVVVQEAVNANPEVRQDQLSTELILAPSFKYYTRTQSTVALYFLSQVQFKTFSDGDSTTLDDPKAMGDNTYNPEEDIELSLILGFGTEWFPTPFFSLGGHIGFDLDLMRQNQNGLAFSTFTSNLTAQVYF